MHSYFANLYEIEFVSQHYHRTLDNIIIWDITIITNKYLFGVTFI